MLAMPVNSSTFRINKKGINNFVSKTFGRDVIYAADFIFNHGFICF